MTTRDTDNELRLILVKIRNGDGEEYWIWECDFCGVTSDQHWSVDDVIAAPLSDYYIHMWTEHRHDGNLKGPIQIQPTGDVL